MSLFKALQFCGSVLFGSTITYLGLLQHAEQTSSRISQNTDLSLERLGTDQNGCQLNLLECVFSLKRGFVSDIIEKISSLLLQDKTAAKTYLAKYLTTALTAEWLHDSGGTRKLLKAIQQHGTRSTRIIMADVIADMNFQRESDDKILDVLSHCDERVLVGLTRLSTVNSKISNAVKDLKSIQKEDKLYLESQMENQLKLLLLSLPLSEMDDCTAWFTKSAILSGSSAKQHKRSLSWSFGGDSSLSFAHNFTSMPPEQVELYYLKALTRHSMVSSHRQLMVENGILPILLQELQHRRNNLRIKHEIGRILGNLALEEITHSSIINHGILSVLRSWLFSEDLTLSSHAARTLANLDRDFSQEEFYEDGVYLLHPDKRQSKRIAADVVFVHGLRGGPLKTWRKEGPDTLLKGEDCWPKAWLVNDIPNLRVLMVEYDSSLSNWVSECPSQPETCSLAIRSEQIMKKLRKAGVGKRPVIWITHSMGGLLVKQLLLHAQDEQEHRSICDNTKGVVFYSTPHQGSSLASYSSQARFLLLPSVEVKELCQGSAFLSTLHTRFLELVERNRVKCLSLGETIPLNLSWVFNSVLVSRASADFGVGPFYSLDVNHINVCKPSHPEDPRYCHTKEFIKNILHQ